MADWGYIPGRYRLGDYYPGIVYLVSHPSRYRYGEEAIDRGRVVRVNADIRIHPDRYICRRRRHSDWDYDSDSDYSDYSYSSDDSEYRRPRLRGGNWNINRNINHNCGRGHANDRVVVNNFVRPRRYWY